MQILIYIFIVLFFVLFAVSIEHAICFIRKHAPSIPSGNKVRKTIVNHIFNECPDAKTIVDIGSGWGGMARTVAKHKPSVRIIGLEFMPMPYIFASLRNLCRKNIKFVFGDAFKYLKNTDKKFDIGIVYLLTPEMGYVKDVISKFKMLFVLNYPLPNIKPTKKIKLHNNFMGQNCLYIYKFN